MRMIVVTIVLLATAAVPAFAQTVGTPEPSAPSEQDTRTDHKNNDLQYVLPALKLLLDSKKRAEQKAREKQQTQTPAPTASSPVVTEPSPTVIPAATKPPTRLPISHTPKLAKHIVPAKPSPRPESSAPAVQPAIPTIINTKAAKAPGITSASLPRPTQVSSASPSDTAVVKEIGLARAIGGGGLLLLVLAAGTYFARRFLGFAAPLPHAKAQIDAGTVTAPRFDEASPSISVMIGRGSFSTVSNYPQNASAT
ncbi:MAG: hypothetical protein HY243_03685 [Proteobacteria bacterium]|nr:hypothetical protein [Pseudomonadota bacterium]